MTKGNFLDVIKKWNLDHPYDHAWRERHKVSLFSPEHRKMCPVDMVLEIEEFKFFAELQKDLEKEKEDLDNHFVKTISDNPGIDDKYVPGGGNFLSDSEDSLSSEEFDDLFDNIKV